MGTKETLLAELSVADRSGHLQQVHQHLIDQGLKYKAPSNSQTLLYYVRDSEGKEIGIAALRVRGGTFVFSFPKTYWQRRAMTVTTALAQISVADILEIDPSDPSSKESMRQLRVSSANLECLLRIIGSTINEHAAHAASAA
jgi:hypothetical protein